MCTAQQAACRNRLPGGLWIQTLMLYLAYEAHSDIIEPAKSMARSSLALLGQWGGLANVPVFAQSFCHVRADRASRIDPRAACLRDRFHHGRQPGGRGQRGPDAEIAVRDAAEFQEGRRASSNPACWSSHRFRATSPRCCAHTVRTLLPDHDVYITDWHNARDVSLDARPLRLRRLRRLHHPLPRGAGPRRPPRRRLPALRAGARRRGGDGGRRQSGAAEQHDADGGPGRHAHQPDQGQQARDQQADELV